MRRRWMLPILMVAAAALPVQSAAQQTAVPTETQQRLDRSDRGGGFDWTWLGLLGLFGLFGLRRGTHADDGYKPAPLE